MSLKIYNTLSGKKEDFIPIEEGKVSMYVCGPTVYDTSHIGHARSVVVFDMVFRWLTRLEYEVTYVRNFTDVDDKIIKKSNETGESCTAITEKYIDEFHNEMDALNVLRPTMEPKATEHINHIIDFIGKLIDKGKAYPVEGGDVYFSIDSFKEYGKLSGRNPDDMRAGARIAVDEKKRSPLDFTLWKPAKPGEPSWESPWGKGRPGWHIECSAMSAEYLGRGFDIHGGGKDLIFPHHENEIAQSEALFGGRFVKYWIHNGFVDINNEKMSKSLGNFTMIKEVLADHSPEVIRLFLLSKQYRSPIDYSEDSMKEVSQGLDRVYAFLERLDNAGIQGETKDRGPLWEDFSQAMNDDFNSARALAAVFEAVKKGNKLLDQTNDAPDADMKKDLERVYADVKSLSGVLGIFQEDPKDWFRTKKDKGMSDKAIDPAEVDGLIQERADARKSKDFARADEIRDQLQAMNIVLEDGPGGTTWRFE
ncbi:cysteine--tRNA ligase [Desulfospira joergensenii]|uniref:cysteine--tRNA ligase n=1 Tax=Desulfospira joergensenii TaxID=53329 RepID=UPI0003B76366|nr:cysteine--tRNA ligase [Desulfospira joergensenii]